MILQPKLISLTDNESSYLE